MLRRYRSLKKIVYAAFILFATIVLYAGTSSHDYHQDRSEEWALPMVARSTYHMDAALHEPLHRLPLGPFEDHPVPIVVEELHLQIPTFEDIKAEDVGPPSNVPAGPPSNVPAGPPSNVSHSNLNDLAQNPAVVKPPGPPAVAAATSGSAVSSPAQAKDHAPLVHLPAQEIHHASVIDHPPAPISHPAPEIRPIPEIPAAPDIHPALAVPKAPIEPRVDQGSSEERVPAPEIPAAMANPSTAHGPAKPPAVITNISLAAPPKPQIPPAKPAAPLNAPAAAVHSPPNKPLPNFNKTAAEIANRLNHTRFQCDKFQIPYKVDSEVYQLPKLNMSYCKISKAGCTYWEQVISFLNKPAHELAYLGIKMPFQISKFDIRYTSHFNLPRRDFKKEADVAEIMKSTRILFVRHPLERLWSCYLEKFYLIDFWTTAGVSMKTTGAETKCPKSITFREFVEFTLPLYNDNWAPMTELCNPCHFRPHILGHVETLREDSYFTLKTINQEWIFTEHDKFSREENQMLDMAIYNYQLHSINWYSFYHKCLTQKELALKLWDVFRKVGYLSSHAVLPDNLPDYNQTTIVRELKVQFRKFPLGHVNGRAQQLKTMRRDYESLPKPIMAKVLEKYAMDFQLFGYSTQLPTS